jgi:hypothetical protein
VHSGVGLGLREKEVHYGYESNKKSPINFIPPVMNISNPVSDNSSSFVMLSSLYPAANAHGRFLPSEFFVILPFFCHSDFFCHSERSEESMKGDVWKWMLHCISLRSA